VPPREERTQTLDGIKEDIFFSNFCQFLSLFHSILKHFIYISIMKRISLGFHAFIAKLLFKKITCFQSWIYANNDENMVKYVFKCMNLKGLF
jgi:hypothetical protein